MDELQQDQQRPQQSESVVHRAVSCDVCGVLPIVGTRYHSRSLWNYDVCETCFLEGGHDLADYNAFASPPSEKEIKEAGTELTPEQVHYANSPLDAVMFLNNNNNVSRSDGISNSKSDKVVQNVANYHFSYHMEAKDYEALASTLAKNSTLTFLRISMRAGRMVSTSSCGERNALIARGISANTSIRRLHWRMTGPLTESTKIELYNMIVQNRTLEELFIDRGCHCPSWLPVGNSRIILLNDDYYAEDDVAQTIILAIQHNKSLKRVRLDGFNPLSNDCKRLFAEAIAKNHSLVKIYAHFLEEDSYLDLLLEDKRHGWSQRFCDTHTSAEDRIRVLVEAKEVTKFGSVQSLFHLLRQSPDVLNQQHVVDQKDYND